MPNSWANAAQSFDDVVGKKSRACIEDGTCDVELSPAFVRNWKAGPW